jgi:hypothetical protein
MTNQELDRARAKEAQRLFLDGDELAVVHAARLAREGWTPPVAVDPDIAEAEEMYKYGPNNEIAAILAGIKRGRELERAVMGNPIPEQIQEVTPPEPVNPDLAEAEKLAYAWNVNEIKDVYGLALAAIKRGRALAAAEAKPTVFDALTANSALCRAEEMIRAAKRTLEIITPPAEDVA